MKTPKGTILNFNKLTHYRSLKKQHRNRTKIFICEERGNSSPLFCDMKIKIINTIQAQNSTINVGVVCVGPYMRPMYCLLYIPPSRVRVTH
jgi:hypothetical protein